MSALSVAANVKLGNVLQQQQQNNNNNNNINGKVHGSDLMLMRKNPPQILPATKELAKGDILLTNAAARKKGQQRDPGGRQHNPPPVAVARRNARERNRVKQVNNGFANLREHIPHAIAAAFESNSGRGGNKKLSKVETLRMAVEYIRSLEDLLSMDESESTGNMSSSSTSSSVSSYTGPQSPSTNQQTSSAYSSYPGIMSPSMDDDDLSTNPTPPPQPQPATQQYLTRIPGTNTYQIITTHLYDDSENVEPLEVDEELLTDPSLMDPDLVHDLSLLNSMHTTASLSPEVYSEHSLSPCGTDTDSSMQNQHHNFIPIIAANTSLQTNIKLRLSPVDGVDIKIPMEPPVISLPTESVLAMDQQHSMIDVMTWWEQQQQQQIHHVHQKS